LGSYPEVPPHFIFEPAFLFQIHGRKYLENIAEGSVKISESFVMNFNTEIEIAVTERLVSAEFQY